MLLTWLPMAAGMQIRGDAAEKKLEDAEAQLRSSGQREAELSARVMDSDSKQGNEAHARQELAELHKRLQLLQQSHQDLSERYMEASSTCGSLQVAYSSFLHA